MQGEYMQEALKIRFDDRLIEQQNLRAHPAKNTASDHRPKAHRRVRRAKDLVRKTIST